MSHPRIQPDQQIFLMARRPIADVLTNEQLYHLRDSGKLFAANCDDKTPCEPHIHLVNQEGDVIYRFSVPTFSPKWHVDVFVHRSSTNLLRDINSRSKRPVHAVTLAKYEPGQKEGLLAELHFSADSLSELVIVHEAVHAGGHLARTLGVIDAKKLAARILTSQSTIIWREEIQCRTVELICKEVVTTLATLGIPCILLRDAAL